MLISSEPSKVSPTLGGNFLIAFPNTSAAVLSPSIALAIAVKLYDVLPERF